MKMGELPKRISTAVVGVPILVFALIKGGYVLLTIVAFVTIVGLWEFFNIMELRGYRPLKISGYISGLLIIFSAYFMHNYFLILIGVFLFILFIGLFEKDNKAALSGIGGTVFGVFYIAGLLSFALKLRNMGLFFEDQYKILGSFLAAKHINEGTGVYAIFFAIAVIFISDTGAYFIGKNYGKRRIAPNISPKKSWEGVAGGIAASIIAAYIIWWIAPVRFPLKHAIILSVILSLVGVAGDLVESRIKRDADIKDSGTIFPGHGGILDRIDALLFGLPVAYIYFLLYLKSILTS